MGMFDYDWRHFCTTPCWILLLCSWKRLCPFISIMYPSSAVFLNQCNVIYLSLFLNSCYKKCKLRFNKKDFGFFHILRCAANFLWCKVCHQKKKVENHCFSWTFISSKIDLVVYFLLIDNIVRQKILKSVIFSFHVLKVTFNLFSVIKRVLWFLALRVSYYWNVLFFYCIER